MARLTPTTKRDVDIEAVMKEFGVDEIEAAFIAALERGEIDGDIVFTKPLTAEERRRFGLDIVVGEEDELNLDDEDDAGG